MDGTKLPCWSDAAMVPLRGLVAVEILDRLKVILPPAHLVLLAATVAQANFTSRFNNVFGVELP